MAVTPADVRSLGGAPFSGLSDASIQVWLDLGAGLVSEGFFRSYYDSALTVWTLHQIASTALSGSPAGLTGPVQSMSVGSVSASFGSGGSNVSSSQYESTSWGRLYLMYIRVCGGGLTVANKCQSG